MIRGRLDDRLGRGGAPRDPRAADLQASMARQRHRRGSGAHRRARPGGDGLCAGGRPSGHRGPVRDDPPPPRVRRPWAKPGPRARPRFVARPPGRGDDRTPDARRPDTRRRPCGRTRARLGSALYRLRRPAARHPHGTAVQADPHRHLERARAHDLRRATAQALRVQRRGRRRAGRGDRLRHGPHRWPDELHGPRARARLDRDHPRLPSMAAADPGDPHRGRRFDRTDRGSRPCGQRRRPGGRDPCRRDCPASTCRGCRSPRSRRCWRAASRSR